MINWRDHTSEDPTKCWCGERPIATVHGLAVGVAIPLETGGYAIEFFNTPLGQQAKVEVEQFGTPVHFTTMDGEQIMSVGHPQS